ncbi:MAG: SusE domain-containing protein [Bacteroidetes bacterium]|nr:SusE domain-containing protein [Bacteroidota bacterium]
MKNIKNIGLITTLIIGIALSCTQIENTPNYTNGKSSFTVTPSTATVSATASDSLNTVLTLTWNDPKLAVGLANTMFTVYLSPTGTSFATFTTKTFTGGLSGIFTGKDLNGMAAKLGGKVGQSITLDVKVIASQENNNSSIVSNVTQVAFSPYGDLSLNATSVNKVLSAANSSHPTDTLSWGKAFKGYSGVVTYQLQYAKGGTSFAAPTSGAVSSFSQIYTVANLNNMTIGIGGASGVATPVDFRIVATNELGNTEYSNVVTLTITPYAANNSIDLIGDATPGGWSTGTEMYRPDPVNNPANWTINIKLIGGNSVKFRADQAWTTNWGSSSWPSGTATLGSPNNIAVSGTTGYYQVNFNAGTGAYNFTAITVPSIPNGLSLTGDAIGGWGVDTHLTQDPSNNTVYTGTVTLTVGSLKFRHTGDWSINWGGPGPDNDPSNYPSAYGKLNNGGNIKINTAGTYFVWIDIGSGEYMFGPTAAAIPFTPLGVVGDATPNGWNGPDIAMIQNPTNPYKWSVKATLVGGKSAKFRVNNDWTNNWGATAFPSGIAVLGNPGNIPVGASASYQITFNSLTGEYYFWQ